MALPWNRFSSGVRTYIGLITDHSTQLSTVKVAKDGSIAHMFRFLRLGADARGKDHGASAIKQYSGEDLFECLIDLTDYIHSQTDALPEQTAGGFNDYSDIIDAAVDRAKSKESSRVNEDEEPPKKRQKLPA